MSFSTERFNKKKRPVIGKKPSLVDWKLRIVTIVQVYHIETLASLKLPNKYAKVNS